MKTAKALLTGHPPTVKVTTDRPPPDTLEISVPNTPVGCAPEGPEGLVAQIEISGEEVKELLGITDEQQKYLKCWNVPEYRNYSPGEHCIDMFLEAIDVTGDQTLIDWGCGTGRAGLKLSGKGFDVTLVDFASNCLDDTVVAWTEDPEWPLRFVEHSIIEKTAMRADYGYCCDVMEHLPPEEVDDALDVILESCTDVFFQIATTQDHFGQHPDINHPLHLSVHGYQWWLKKFVSHGVRVHRSLEKPGAVIFFVSGYTGFSFDKLKQNTVPDLIYKQIRANSELGIKQLVPHIEQADQEVVVLGGGPSLNGFVDEIKERKANGAKIVTLNGSYTWAKRNDLWPVTQFMIDARPFNSRFIDPPDERNLYIIASQCHPSTFKTLPLERTFLWQVNLDDESVKLCNEVFGEVYSGWFPVPGGSTVMLRALPALQMLGFRKIHIYGFDSCLMDGDHHAYEQLENDIGTSNHDIGLEVEGRNFVCHPWMLSQAKEFIDVKERLLRRMDITVHGDGLIAHLLQTNADILED